MTKKKKKKIRSNTEVIGPKTSPPFIIHFTPLHHILKPWRTHDILRGNIVTRETCVQPQAQKTTTCEQSWFNRLRISNIRRGESMPTKTKCAARLLTTSHRISKISQDFLVCTRTISWIHQHFWFFLKNSDQVGRVVLADQIFQTLSNPIRGNTEGGALHVVSGSCSRGSRALLRLDMAGGQRETVRRLHTVGGWGRTWQVLTQTEVRISMRGLTPRPPLRCLPLSLSLSPEPLMNPLADCSTPTQIAAGGHS